MLQKVRILDYDARAYSYCPPTVDAIINLMEVVSAVPCESRSSEPTMSVRFTDGKTLTVVGKPDDLLVPAS